MRKQRSTTGLVIAGILALLTIIALVLWSLEEPVPTATTGHATATPEPAPTVMPKQTAVAREVTPRLRPAVVPPSSFATEFPVFVRAWTPDGKPASGGEVVFSTVQMAGQPVAEEGQPLPQLRLGETGEGTQSLPGPAQYMALARAEGLAAQERFTIGSAAATHLDLVLLPAVSVAGRVVDEQSNPVVSATVACIVAGQSVDSVLSNEEGQFSFPYPLPRECKLRAESEGFAPTLSDPLMSDAQITLVMSRGSRLIVTVRDDTTSRPVENFEVVLKGDWKSGLPVRSGLSGSDGMLTLEAVAPGDYTIRAGNAAYALLVPYQTVKLVAGETFRTELRLTPAGAISGVVRDGDTQSGIPGAQITAMLSGTATFDVGRIVSASDGTFSIKGLPPGTYSVGVRGLPAQYGQRNEFATVQQQRIEIGSGESHGDLVFEFFTGASLKGRVVFADGTPAPGAKVYVDAPVPDAPEGTIEWAVDTVTDPEGQFSVYQLPDAALRFHAEWRGKVSDVLGPVPPGAPEEQNIMLTLNDAPTGTLAGKVVDETGKEVRAHVRAEPLQTSERLSAPLNYTTQGDGHFLFVDVPVGDYEFHFEAYKDGLVNYTHAWGSVSLAANQVIDDIVLRLESSGLNVSGVVYLPTGEVARDYMIEMTMPDEEGHFQPVAVVKTDSNGVFNFENLEEGAYRLEPQTHEDGSWRMDVQAGETVEITLPEPGEEPQPGPRSLD